MKRKIFVAIIIFITVGIIFTKPFVVYLAKAQLKKQFKGSEVSIRDCSSKLLSLFVFSDIEVKKNPDYEVQIKEVKVSYDFFSLIKRSILQIEAKDAAVKVNLGQKGAVDLINKYLRENAQNKSNLSHLISNFC